jgi:hypothetical protein
MDGQGATEARQTGFSGWSVKDYLFSLSTCSILYASDDHPHFLDYATNLAGALRNTIFVDQANCCHFLLVIY